VIAPVNPRTVTETVKIITDIFFIDFIGGSPNLIYAIPGKVNPIMVPAVPPANPNAGLIFGNPIAIAEVHNNKEIDRI